MVCACGVLLAVIKNRVCFYVRSINRRSGMITDAGLLTGMCGDGFYFYLFSAEPASVLVLCAREQRRRGRETSMSVFASCWLCF